MGQILLVDKALSSNALRACVYIYIQQLRSFRAPMLWFINLTVPTCLVQYIFLSLCQFLLGPKAPSQEMQSVSSSFFWGGVELLIGSW